MSAEVREETAAAAAALEPMGGGGGGGGIRLLLLPEQEGVVVLQIGIKGDEMKLSRYFTEFSGYFLSHGCPPQITLKL